MQVNLTNTLVVPVRKTGDEFTIDLSKLDNSMIQRIFEYGARQISNDCHSAVSIDPDKLSDDELLSKHAEVTALIEKRWDAIYSGEWRVRTAGEQVDPTTREAMRLAREELRAAVSLRSQKNKDAPKWKDIEEDAKAAATERKFKSDEAGYMAKAKANLAQRREAANVAAGSLADLGL